MFTSILCWNFFNCVAYRPHIYSAFAPSSPSLPPHIAVGLAARR
jgi:hypothetical protein